MSKILVSNSLRGGVILSAVPAQGWLIPAPPECRGPAARVCRGRQPLTGPARETVEEQPECRGEDDEEHGQSGHEDDAVAVNLPRPPLLGLELEKNSKFGRVFSPLRSEQLKTKNISISNEVLLVQLF